MARRREYQSFFDEVAASRLDLPVAVQNELAAIVQRTYTSQTLGVAPSQIGSLPIQNSLVQQYLPGVNTIGGIESALQQSVVPQLLGMTQRLVENRASADPSAIFSDLYAGALGSARTYNPGQSTFAHYASRQAFQAASSSRRSDFRNVSLDALVGPGGDPVPGVPSTLGVSDPQLDTWLDEFAGISAPGISAPAAPYTVPSQRWFDPLMRARSPIPTPFYAPTNQPFGLLAHGQLNPNLSTRPGQGLAQVYADPAELSFYANKYASNASVFRTQPAPVQRFLRQTAEGMRGGGFVSTDAEMIGSVAGADQALIDTQAGEMGDPFNYTGISLNTGALSYAPRAKNLPGFIRKIAATDPATAGAIYLQSAATGRITPNDIRRISVPSGDKNLGEYVSNNFESLTDAMGVVENGFGYTNTDVEDLQRVVAQLRTSSSAQVQAGELMAEGVMKGTRLENTATYNQGRSAVQNAVRSAEQAQRVRMNVAPTEIGRLMDQTNGIPSLEEAVAAVKRGMGVRASVDETPAVPEPTAPPVADSAYGAPVSSVGNSGGQPPRQPPTATAAPAADPDPFNQPASTGTQAGAQARADAVAARQWMEQNYPEYRPGKGRAPAWLKQLRQENPEFARRFNALIADRELAGSQSVLRTWQNENNVAGAEAASASAAATPPAAASVTASSNGSGGVGGATPTPGVPDPDSYWTGQQFTARARQLEAERTTEFTAGAGNFPRSARQMGNMVEAARTEMSAINAGNVYSEGSFHGVYGLYSQASGGFTSVNSGLPTVSNRTIAAGAGVYQSAVNQAFDQGGFEGLSNKEFAATIHKRVQQGIQRIVDGTVEEMVKASPESAAQAKSLGQQLRTVANDMLSQGDSALRQAGDTSRIGDTNMSSIRAHGQSLRALAETSPELTQRIDELGGMEAVANGPRRVLLAGDQSYEVGASDYSGRGGGGGSWSDRIKSIYQTNLGHAMMAQFMASMAWKSTGGEVLDSANQWATRQYGYVGLERFGGGEASAASLSTSRRELADNFSGRLAYEQYGMFNELGYLTSNLPGGEGLVRGINDVKMGLGVSAVAGVGTWGLGALVGSAALTGAAAPVAGIAGAAIAIPSLAMTTANTLTGSDSYMGWSWKNSVAGLALNASGVGGVGFSSSGVWQEEQTQRAKGMSAKEYVSQSWVGDALGTENVNWLFGGRDADAQQLRGLSEEVMRSTGLKEDAVLKQLSGLQTAFGGLDTDANRKAAKLVMDQASKQGIDASAILSGAGSMASQRGILTGTDEFRDLVSGFAGLDPVQQQRELLKSSRDYQRYGQWSGYLSGGNAEAYELYNLVGGTNAAQTQAVQSVFAQAQMSGVNLTAPRARMLATQVADMAPYRAMDITQMASSMTQLGSGSFMGNFNNLASSVRVGQFGFNLSDAGNLATGSISMAGGNTADTLNFLKGVTSGNPYALSDYGRMANIGVLQSMDQNGLQTGLQDMSGLLLYAQQNKLQNAPRLTQSEILSGLGMNFEATDKRALLEGGIWGYQQSYTNQVNSLQAQGLDLQFAQLASQKQFTYAGWGIEDRTMQEQWSSQLRNFQYQGTMMDTQHRFQQEDAEAQRERMNLSVDNQRWQQGFDYQTSLMRRDWSREDYQYSTQMRSMQFGWNMEDINEQIRRSSGYERSLLIKQRDRTTISQNMESGHAEDQFERQEQLWKREDERYEKGLEFGEQMIKLDEERFERNQRQNEEMYQLQKTHLAEEVDSAKELHALRLEMENLQRERQKEQLANSEASLNIQKQMQAIGNEYQKNMTTISHTQAEMEAQLRKITSYSPAFSRMLGDFLHFLETATQTNVSTSSARTSR